MKTILTSRIVNQRLWKIPAHAGRGEVLLASNCVSRSSPFSCFSGWATWPVWTCCILGSSHLCDSHVTCHWSLALSHFVQSKSHFLASFPRAFALLSLGSPGRERLLLHLHRASCPGQDRHSVIPYTQNHNTGWQTVTSWHWLSSF